MVYTIKNISAEPATTVEIPSFQLVDGHGVAYSRDLGATTAYDTGREDNHKILSDLNPGLSEDDKAVFEVSSQLFDAGGWKLKVEGNDDVQVPLN